jgi:adenylate cyclase class IV
MLHPIELELRGELHPTDTIHVRTALFEAGFHHRDTTKRTMLMSFGNVGRIAEDNPDHTPDQETDIRCRITNGEAEVVVKLGGLHTHNRQEISTLVSLEELANFARVVGAFNMLHKVGSRTTENFVRNDIVASIISSKSGLMFIELEKISDEDHAQADRQELTRLAHQLGVTLWPGREAFMEFCGRITQQDDWMFHGKEEEVQKFLAEIQQTGSGTTPQVPSTR